MLQQYEVISKLGEGAYGIVYQVRHKRKKTKLAMKMIKVDPEEGVPSTTIREISILKGLSHPNIVKLLQASMEINDEREFIGLGFELMKQDLAKFIRSQRQLSAADCKKIFHKIACGVHYLHQRNIYHRDLKPQNILIDDVNSVKIADFGLSKTIFGNGTTVTLQIATLWYRAPQVLLGAKFYDHSLDVWALGCIFFEIIHGSVLFKGDSEIGQLFRIFEIVGTPKSHDFPEGSMLPHFKKTFPKMQSQLFRMKNGKLDSLGVNLLQRMLKINPKDRITTQEVLDHAYFQGML